MTSIDTHDILNVGDGNSYRDLEGKTVYIAGRMRGHDLYNFPAFDEMRDRLKSVGAIPISPADLDRVHGFNESEEIMDFSHMARQFMRRDLNAISDCCDAIMVIGTDHSLSLGVQVEVAMANFLGLPVYYEEEMHW